MPGRKIEDSSAVYLDAVPALSYSVGRDSLVLALQSAAAVLGREISYSMLKGLSALAFRLIFHQDWRRYTPDALQGYNHSHLAFNCLGFKPVASHITPGDASAIQKSHMAIVESIKAGFPVLGLHLMDWEDWGVIAGYTHNGETLLCRSPHDRDTTRLVANKSWPVMTLEFRPSTTNRLTSRRAMIIQSLRTAVDLFKAEQFGPYYSGRDAFLYWISGLRDERIFSLLEERGGQEYSYWINLLRATEAENIRMDRQYSSPYLERAHVNAWRLESLIDARRAASQYLNDIFLLFEGDLSGLLFEASQCYSRVESLLEGTRSCAPWDYQLNEIPWTNENRLEQASALEQALGIEGQAVEYLQTFLDRVSQLPL